MKMIFWTEKIFAFVSAILLANSIAKAQDAANPFDAINSSYQVTVKPIFQTKCFDCHSNQTRWPWYHSLPGIKQLLEQDAAEGREHLDLSDDFPFGGHGSPIEDLDAIDKTLKDGSMPPWKYKLMHRSSRLTAEEKQIILDWINKSKSLVSQ